MANKKQVTTAVGLDVYEELAEFREEKEIHDAEAARRAIRRGLESETIDERLDRIEGKQRENHRFFVGGFVAIAFITLTIYFQPIAGRVGVLWNVVGIIAFLSIVAVQRGYHD